MSSIRRSSPLPGPVDGVVAVPGSKSIANRALVCAGLASGTSRLVNVPDGDDTVAMLAGLAALGANVDADVAAGGGTAVITGIADPAAIGPATVHAGLAGTTSRFLTAVAALGSSPVTIDGDPALRRRPFAPLHAALAGLGVTVIPGDGEGRLPVTVEGPPTHGAVAIPGDVSSQYVTALMLIGPLLPGGLRLRLTTPLVSRPYVAMTAAVMASFGVTDVELHESWVVVDPDGYVGSELTIEPDASSASYPLAIAAVRGGAVVVDGLGTDSLQGDARFAELLAQMGCEVERGQRSTRVVRRPDAPLHGIDVDMADISDLVPTLATVALFAASPTRIRGVGFIRGKESDRLGDLACELRALGGEVDETEDGLLIHPSAARLHGASLATHHDHRLAMAFGVIATVVDGVEIADPQVVSKSWPSFWAMVDRLVPS
jgi:3-phosphoshikimate 1-carboxyvinyltransferase